MEFHRNKRKNEFRVGLFSLIALVILFLSYSWFTDLINTAEQVELKVKFANAANIEQGSPVTIFGIKRGRVKDLEITSDGVLAYLLVELNEPLKKGTGFRIEKTDLMGETKIEIIPGKEAEELDITKIHYGKDNLSISQMIVKINQILEIFTPLIKNKDEVSGVFREMSVTISNLKELITKVNTSYDENIGKIENLLANSEKLSQEIVDYIETAELQNTVRSGKKTIENFDELILEFQESNRNIKQLTNDMLNKDGSLQRLLQEKDLYENLLRSTASLDSLLQDIKENPKKYFEVKVF